MGFNSAFKGLMIKNIVVSAELFFGYISYISL